MGLPPTSSKGDSESGFGTTFKTDYDKIPVTRTGVEIKIGTIPIEQGGTGSTTQNFVDLTTDQTVAGKKTLSDQLAVGGEGNTNAILDLTSTTKAFIPPRMTTIQKLAIPSPIMGMEVFDTDILSKSIYDGSTWTSAGGPPAGLAPLDSPDFTGVPTAPPSPPYTMTNQIATTDFASSAVQLMAARNWTRRALPVVKDWGCVAFGGDSFVVIAGSGPGDAAMRTPDGVNWSVDATITTNEWKGLCYGDGLFVAVASSGTGNRVMTSSSGFYWTSRTSAADKQWVSVCYGNGLFVAVAEDGATDTVMTSPDGISWTSRTAASGSTWKSVCYGNGLFVAVAPSTYGGTNVMTSPDGISWTSRTAATTNSWNAVTYGKGLFVAIAQTGSGDRAMTSPDGINWTSRTTPNDSWQTLTYGNGVFLAISGGYAGNTLASSDGINWVATPIEKVGYWSSIAYGNGLFLTVGNYGSEHRAMTSLRA